MRFMMIMYPGPQAETETTPVDSAELFAAMGRYNEELVKAGALLAGEGLKPSKYGARVRFGAGKPTVTDGPFTESKEIIGGYWLIQVKSKEEAVAWATRAPCPAGEMIELRQVYELEDFPSDVLPPEEAARERALREQMSKQAAAKS